MRTHCVVSRAGPMETSSVAADAGNDCCVCAEELINDNQTPCCRQRIHADCFARCLERLARTCPLCRARVARTESLSAPEPLEYTRYTYRPMNHLEEWLRLQTEREPRPYAAAERGRFHTMQRLARTNRSRAFERSAPVQRLDRDYRRVFERPLPVELGIRPPQNSLTAHDAIWARICRDLDWL